MLFEDKVMYNTSLESIHGSDIQEERISKRWRCASLSSVWIPAHLLPDRSKSRYEWTQKTAFHMLQRYESQDFKNSFSVYSDSELEKRNSDSDSEEEYFHDYTEKLKDFSHMSDNLSSKGEENDSFHELRYSSEQLTITNDTLHDSPSKLSTKTSDRLSGLSQNFTDSLDKGSYDNLVSELSTECSANNFISESLDKCCDNDLVTKSRSIKEVDESFMLNENGSSGSHEKLNVLEAEFIYAKKKSNDMYGKRSGAKKEKKNKSKAKNTMPLDCFWQTVDSDSIPEVDEFYESIIREKNNLYNPVGINSISEFPQLNNFQSSTKKMQSLDCSKVNAFEEPFVEREVSTVPEDTEVKVEEHDAGAKILVIENIPEDIQEESVVSLVSDYGQLKEMRKSGAFSTAEFWILPDVELDWLISCFDGHQPFGAYSSVLHCYEKFS